MSSTDLSLDSAPNRFQPIWLLTLAIAGLPVIFGLSQVWIFFDESFPHLYHSRTLAALAAVVLGVAGIAAPLGVWMKRGAFRRWSRGRQWGAMGAVLFAMLIVYLLPFLLLIEASRNSRAILAYTPSVVLIFSEKEGLDALSWGVAGGPGTGHGSASRSARGKIETHTLVEWHAPLEPMHLPRPPDFDPVVHLRAEGSLKPLRLEARVETGQTVLFKTVGFRDAVVTQQGKPVALPTELAPGTHHFAIQAGP